MVCRPNALFAPGQVRSFIRRGRKGVARPAACSHRTERLTVLLCVSQTPHFAPTDRGANSGPLVSGG